MLKVFKYFKRNDWLVMLLCVLLVAGQVGLDLALPDYMSEITMLVQTPGSLMQDIFMCAEHGANLTGVSPVTGIYRQV